MSAATPNSLVDVLRNRALELPGQRAFTFLADGELEAESVTFAELDLRSRALAALLQRRHGPGERALLLFPPGIDFIVAFFACLYAGIVAIPAYPPRQSRPGRWAPRLGAVARDADARIVLSTERIAGLTAAVQREVPQLQRAHWLQTTHVPPDEADYWQKPPKTGGDTLAFLQYTSGSTADPKGVMVSHGNLLHNLAYGCHVEENDCDSVSVSWLPVYHDMGLIEAVLQPVYSGYSAYLMPPVAFLQRPLRWLQAITRYRATNSGGPNFAFDLCVDKIPPEERQNLDLSSWRVAYNGAEPIRWKTLTRFHEAFRSNGFQWRAFYPVYGLAEATLVVSSGRQADEPRVLNLSAQSLAGDRAVGGDGTERGSRHIISCGPCSCGSRVEIVQPETGELCRPGEIGEIWIKGPSVTQGYWNRIEETRRTFNARLSGGGDGPFLRTGDLGFVDGGELFPSGRIKDLIIIRGRKHYPHDIERSVEAGHQAIRSGCVAAFGITCDDGERLAVVVELDHHYLRGAPDFAAVLAVVRETIAEQHEIPLYAAALLTPGGIPKTSSGKIKRYACRNGLLEGTLQPLAHWVTAHGDGEGQ